MAQTTRRSFMARIAAGSTVIMAAGAMAQAPAPKLDEKDPTAVALGYSPDSTKVDAKKYPKHAADQKCAGCQLYAGKPKDPMGPCPIFAGKQVMATGWCSAYVKKG